MTLLEAFIHKSGADQSQANAELSFAGLTPTDQYNANDKKQKCALYKALLDFVSRDNAGVHSVSEGGYSITYNADNKGDYLSRLAKESGCRDLIELYGKNVVKNKSYLW